MGVASTIAKGVQCDPSFVAIKFNLDDRSWWTGALNSFLAESYSVCVFRCRRFAPFVECFVAYCNFVLQQRYLISKLRVALRSPQTNFKQDTINDYKFRRRVFVVMDLNVDTNTSDIGSSTVERQRTHQDLS